MARRNSYLTDSALDKIELKEFRQNGLPWLLFASFCLFCGFLLLILYLIYGAHLAADSDSAIEYITEYEDSGGDELFNASAVRPILSGNETSRDYFGDLSQEEELAKQEIQIFSQVGVDVAIEQDAERATWTTPILLVPTTLDPGPAELAADDSTAYELTKAESSVVKWPEFGAQTRLSQFSRFAVVSSNKECSRIGAGVLREGGNAAETAIAVAFCLGALEPQFGGLGGGIVGVKFDVLSNTATAIDGLEASPQSVTDHTFAKHSKTTGPSSIGVPGFVHALWQMFRRYPSGRKTWPQLLQPTISLLQTGYKPSEMFRKSLSKKTPHLSQKTDLRELYASHETVTDFRLAETLRKLSVSRDPQQLFYRGDVANQIVREAKINGGFIQKSDLVNYGSRFASLPGLVINETKTFGPTEPAVTAFSQLLLSLLNNRLQQHDGLTPAKFYHIFLETAKLCLPFLNEIGDPKFSTPSSLATAQQLSDKITNYVKVPDYYGNAADADSNEASENYVSIVDGEGDLFSLKLTMGSALGSLERSRQLGVLWNSAMARFSSFDSVNSVQPRKRPRILAAPLILQHKEIATILMTPTASTKALLSSAFVAAGQIFLQKSLEQAVGLPRVWSLADGVAEFEISMPFILAKEISDHGHSELQPSRNLPAVHALKRSWVNKTLHIEAVCDTREDNCFADGV